MNRIALLLLCLVIACSAPFIGPTPPDHAMEFIYMQLRIPRVLVAGVVGCTFGIVGAAFQALFGNPLATPSTTGTTAGAALGALFAFVVFPSSLAQWTLGVAGFSFLGALIVAFPVAVLASRYQRRMEDVLLAGIALTLAAGALTTGLQSQADMAATQRAVLWSLGSLTQVGYDGILGLAPLCVLCCIGVLTQTRALDALITGEERAQSQGVYTTQTRTIVLGVGSLGIASCVAWCGPIAFVGLIVPHIVRFILGSSRRILLPYSGIVGAAFLITCDVAARFLSTGSEVPVGVMTAAVGAPLLIVLVLKQQ